MPSKFANLDHETSPTARPGWMLRGCAICVAMVPIAALAVVSQLDPDESGLGTHQQLGLPPCTMRVLLAVRCPVCGMTTSWAHFVRGQWWDSMRVNLGGFLLAFYSLAVITMLIRVGWRGSWPGSPTQTAATVALVSIAGLTLLDWAGRLVLESYW